MGSTSDWPTMQEAAKMLKAFGVEFEAKVVSAHRTPNLLVEFAESAAENGFSAIIAGAGGAAHLPGMVAAWHLRKCMFRNNCQAEPGRHRQANSLIAFNNHDIIKMNPVLMAKVVNGAAGATSGFS